MKKSDYALITGRCYDHNFQRFFPIFGEKIAVVLKNQCYDHFLHKPAAFCVKISVFLPNFSGKTFFLKS
jgi:hypothetical protein